jgi:ribosome modulation factor
MSDQQRSQAYHEGEIAGRDIDRQAGDCPYDHDPEGALQRRKEWMAGFAAGRQDAAPAETARDYRPVDRHGQITPELPVYNPG